MKRAVNIVLLINLIIQLNKFINNYFYFLIGYKTFTPPMNGCNTSGTLTEPSAFWNCSTMAGTNLDVAKPDAFNV